MALRTREQYLNSLRSMRPNVYKFGELIEDVTTNPATRRVVESHARGIEAAHDLDLADIFTTTSGLTGEAIHRHTSLMTTPEEMIYNSKLKREMYHLTGSCTGALCVGWNGFNVMWSVTHDMDEALGTDYHQRLKEWGLEFQKKGLLVAGALTDAKGDRKLRPHQQADLDTNLRIVERRDDGIVIRGAKLMICGTAAAEEIFLMPGSAYREDDQDFSLACVVPRDIEGLIIVETRHPSDGRELEEGFDCPTETGITQAYLIFEDVFVPKERVFMAGEYKYTGDIINRFTSTYRACIGACVAGQGDVMAGAAALIARANGLSAKTFRDKLSQMELNNETTFTMGVGSIALGREHPSGTWLADSLTSHGNKIHVATLPYETKRLTQEIGGGIVETGCMPSYKDFTSPQYGHLIQKYLTAGAGSAETRVRLARLIEWLTIGGGVPGCMHGGGSPDGARMVVFNLSPLERYAGMARKLAGVEEDLEEPARKK
ncbi:MAG: 4-hydroxyphenylacetate 3-hydroxylase [Deltaproteobacteria bacterium]|nr:4-hydroxyphenylacetate 3-hydroxylase [Deltaproteobacteria bacterium]